jgi:hypothetical protein
MHRSNCVEPKGMEQGQTRSGGAGYLSPGLKSGVKTKQDHAPKAQSSLQSAKHHKAGEIA